jgi:hypothetical protein
VLYNCPTICSNGSASPGVPVVGHLQQVVPDTAVDFVSQEAIQVVGPGYNAVSGASSTIGFDDLAISVPGQTFTSIIFDLTLLASATDGTVTFTAKTVSGGPFVSSAFFDSHTGQNYFTVTTNSGTQITELDILSTQFQDNASQVRIGGVSNTTIVPEPASYGLAGFALLGLAFLRRRHAA